MAYQTVVKHPQGSKTLTLKPNGVMYGAMFYRASCATCNVICLCPEWKAEAVNMEVQCDCPAETTAAAELKRRVFDAQISVGIAANYDAELGDSYADPGASRY